MHLIFRRARLQSTIEVNPPEIVPGIEEHEVGLGFLERVLERVREIAESGVGRGHTTRRDGSTQDDQAPGISVEAGEARLAASLCCQSHSTG